ncbi:dockerin type I domain-containing protein [Ruminococcus sp.]|uniref:dockerin type I domain-containing protein n=1 Tax=Ruminococcus sp. TaxID=41978 RepID=UPI0025DC9F00|nr:dockerin type I domain-containing protein [Ruminococcus sp.]MBQ8966055.1 leucine-rich repeat protein [Ruminococcus sp.]
MYKKIFAFVCALVMSAGICSPMDTALAVYADSNEVTAVSEDEQYAEILYDEEYGRYYILDNEGNKLPVNMSYDTDRECFVTSDNKRLNLVQNAKIEVPEHEYPDDSMYAELPDGNAMLFRNMQYYNSIYEEAEGHKITAIGYGFLTPWIHDDNYKYIDDNKPELGIKLTVPDNITYCGPRSLLTWGLDELYLSKNLLCIEESAFMVYDGTLMNNDTFSDLELNDGLKYIGSKAFFGYSALKEVEIPASVEYIGDYSLGYYTDIEKLEKDIENKEEGVTYDSRSSEKYYKKVDNFTIYGYRGTEAENYAKKNDFKFVALDKEEEHITGDVNGDNDINVTDVNLIAAHVKGIRALSGESQNFGDVNSDGDINVTDISLIAAHVKGIRALSERRTEGTV